MTKINKKIISDSISKIIDSLGDNVNKDGVKDTPQRVAKAYEELLSGYDADINKIINNALL